MLNYLFYRIGQFIALATPLKTGYKIAECISDARYLFAFRDQKLVKGNLRAIFPDKPRKEINLISRKLFRNFAKYLVDFFRFEKIDRAFIDKYIKIENIKNFNEAQSKGKGVIVLTAHIGNWELGGLVIGVLGYPFWAVALPHKDKKVDEFFNSQRESKGVHVIPLGKAVRSSLNVLKNNEMVALVGDRDFTKKGQVLDFFGKPSFFPEGPAAFAIQTGAAIVPGFMLRNPDDTFTLTIEKPIEFKATGNKDADIKELILKYKIIFEDYIKRYPEQWYMFRKFWIGK